MNLRLIEVRSCFFRFIFLVDFVYIVFARESLFMCHWVHTSICIDRQWHLRRIRTVKLSLLWNGVTFLRLIHKHHDNAEDEIIFLAPDIFLLADMFVLFNFVVACLNNNLMQVIELANLAQEIWRVVLISFLSYVSWSFALVYGRFSI